MVNTSKQMNYKIVLIGDGEVGKTTLVNRHLNGDFEKRYVSTIGVEVHPLRFGNTCLNIWDCAGQYRFGGLGDGYFIKANACIVMFDLTSLNSFNNVEKWLTSYIRLVGPNTPMILCGSKYDLENKEVTNELIQNVISKYNLVYYDISSKNNYNFDKPFKTLVDMLNNI